MNIRQINDHFFKEMIEQYNKSGDTTNAKECEEFYKMLKTQRHVLDTDNKRIINESIK